MTETTALTIEEITQRNGELGIIFTQQLIADEAIELPSDATLVLLSRDDPELVEANIAMGVDAIRRGENVFFRYVDEARDGR